MRVRKMTIDPQGTNELMLIAEFAAIEGALIAPKGYIDSEDSLVGRFKIAIVLDDDQYHRLQFHVSNNIIIL